MTPTANPPGYLSDYGYVQDDDLSTVDDPAVGESPFTDAQHVYVTVDDVVYYVTDPELRRAVLDYIADKTGR